MLKLSIFIISSYFLNASAQNVHFPTNEIGKYEFTEVVALNGMTRDLLFDNGQKFMKKVKVLNSSKKHYSEDKNNYSLKNKGSFYVYRIGSVKKGIDGAVEYDLTIEIKDGKYRYTLTNFVFNEYQKNRYGKYQPLKGKYIPLEMEVSSLNKKEWEKHRKVVYDKSQELIISLNDVLLYEEVKETKKNKKKDNW